MPRFRAAQSLLEYRHELAHSTLYACHRLPIKETRNIEFQSLVISVTLSRSGAVLWCAAGRQLRTLRQGHSGLGRVNKRTLRAAGRDRRCREPRCLVEMKQLMFSKNPRARWSTYFDCRSFGMGDPSIARKGPRPCSADRRVKCLGRHWSAFLLYVRNKVEKVFGLKLSI